MVAGLASTPTTGLIVQACGDAHLMNFGGLPRPSATSSSTRRFRPYGSGTLKRLVTSVAIAGRHIVL
jgi:hypothetical protein